MISGYKDSFKNPTTNKYKDGTSFEDIYHLYKFDHALRGIFLKYILIAEHSVKTAFAYHFSSVYGEMEQEYLRIENFFNLKTKDSISDTVIHRKLKLERENGRYRYGNNGIPK